MMFDARHLARGWLSVALASGADKWRSQLNRTIHIEAHAHGVRLAATDSYVILHAFIPEIDREDDPAPELDEVPISTATAIDYHGRGKGFLAHALRLATAKDADLVEVKLRLNVLASDRGPQGTLVGLEARSVVLEMPDVERLVLDVYDGAYPRYQPILSRSIDPVATDRIALTPGIIGRLAKLGDIHPNARLGWTFGGENKTARLDVLDSEPYIDGLVMPSRWDFDLNAPRTDDPRPVDDEDNDEEEAA